MKLISYLSLNLKMLNLDFEFELEKKHRFLEKRNGNVSRCFYQGKRLYCCQLHNFEVQRTPGGATLTTSMRDIQGSSLTLVLPVLRKKTLKFLVTLKVRVTLDNWPDVQMCLCNQFWYK